MGRQTERLSHKRHFYRQSPYTTLNAFAKLLQPSSLVPILTPATLLFIKLTFFLFYYQVFKPLRWIRISACIGAVCTVNFYGAATIAQLIFSTPRPGESLLDHFLSGENKKGLKLAVPLSAVGLGIDIVLLVMPIRAVLRLQLPTKQKIGVVSIFMFGLLYGNS